MPDTFTDLSALDEGGALDQHLEACGNAFDPGAGPPFFATVTERLKGSSSDTFELLMYVDPWYEEEGREWLGGGWRRFSDLRLAEATTQVAVSMAERQQAEGLHQSPAFWDGDPMEFSRDGSNSCGGYPTLDPDMRYIAFRDAKGAVLALEPVLYDDDAFLDRLRKQMREPAAFSRTEYPVADLFRSSKALVQAHILDCYGDPGANASFLTEGATLRVERGSPESAKALWWTAITDGETGEYEFDDLWDFYQTRNEACPIGQSVLMLHAELDASPMWEGTSTWVEDRFPGWIDAATARLSEFSDDGPLDPLRFIIRSAYPLSARPRPILIKDGRIRVADIPTGLTLTGPEWVSVDQAFAWFEEGQAARAAATLPSN